MNKRFIESSLCLGVRRAGKKPSTMLVEAIAGLCAGVVARYIVPDSPGIGADTLAGIVGGALGGFIYKLFGHKPPFDDYNAWSIASACVGAFVLILVIRATAGRRTIA